MHLWNIAKRIVLMYEDPVLIPKPLHSPGLEYLRPNKEGSGRLPRCDRPGVQSGGGCEMRMR